MGRRRAASGAAQGVRLRPALGRTPACSPTKCLWGIHFYFIILSAGFKTVYLNELMLEVVEERKELATVYSEYKMWGPPETGARPRLLNIALPCRPRLVHYIYSNYILKALHLWIVRVYLANQMQLFDCIVDTSFVSLCTTSRDAWRPHRSLPLDLVRSRS